MSHPSQAAASVVQSHVRKHLAKKKVDAAMAARTWNVLDAYNEDSGIRRGKEMNDALRSQEFDTTGDDADQMEEDYSGCTTVEELQAAAHKPARPLRPRGTPPLFSALIVAKSWCLLVAAARNAVDWWFRRLVVACPWWRVRVPSAAERAARVIARRECAFSVEPPR